MADRPPASPEAQPRQVAEAFPPSCYIEAEMEARGWNAGDMVRAMGGLSRAAKRRSKLPPITADYVRGLLDGAPLTSLDALRLARAFGTSPDVWMNREAFYREWRASHPTPEGGPR